jgi:enamine deaminase RidA (YjgF/YER057c/UK114 family)
MRLTRSVALLTLCLVGAAVAAGAAHRSVYGVWSRAIFADAAIVEGPARLIFVSGMAAEDPQDGHIHDPGDFAAQCRMSYDKIRKILGEQGAGMADIVRTVAYVTDMRNKDAYVACQREALAGAPPPPHTLLGVSSLAWPGMQVEVEVTAAVPHR